MGLLAPADQEKLRDAFDEMTRPVRLLFFTQTFDCETCAQTKQILDELPALSGRISVEEVNLVLDRERTAEYGFDRAPGIAVLGQNGDGGYHDSRIRFLGAPSGYEFVSLVRAILLVGGGESQLTAESRTRLASVEKPIALQVFTTPTCPHCPRAVSLAHEMAYANPNITAVAVEATEFPDLARQYQVSGVPKTIVSRGAGAPGLENDAVEILGAVPQDAFIEQALLVLATSFHEDTKSTKNTKNTNN